MSEKKFGHVDDTKKQKIPYIHAMVHVYGSFELGKPSEKDNLRLQELCISIIYGLSVLKIVVPQKTIA